MAGVLASITGHVPKATLYVRKYSDQYFELLLQSAAEPALTESLEAVNELLEELETGLSGLPMAGVIASQMASFGAHLGIQEAASLCGFCAVRVQYNPSSIYLDTTSGIRETDEAAAGNIGNSKITMIDAGTITTFGVQLILDDMNQMDAFGMDSPSLASPTGAVASLVTEGIRGGDGFSVRKACEGLVACLFSPVTRQVMFSWSSMIFRGQLNQVNVNYTMFNKKGEPIRATVDIAIQQIADTQKDEKNGYWDRAFNKAFAKQENGLIAGAAKVASKVANNALMNINI